MNSALFNRIKAGGFMQVVLKGDAAISGYGAADPHEAGKVRLDGMLLNESGNLERVSLQLEEDDIAAVHFLPEAPVFIDLEGNEISMEHGFFREL